MNYAENETGDQDGCTRLDRGEVDHTSNEKGPEEQFFTECDRCPRKNDHQHVTQVDDRAAVQRVQPDYVAQ